MEGAEVAVGVPDRRDGGAVTLRLTGEPGLAGFGRCDSVLKSDTVSIVILRILRGSTLLSLRAAPVSPLPVMSIVCLSIVDFVTYLDTSATLLRGLRDKRFALAFVEHEVGESSAS